MITIPFIKLPGFIAGKKLKKDSKNVKSTDFSEHVKNAVEGRSENNGKENSHRGYSRNHDEASGHIDELVETVKSMNLLLAEKGAFYRFNLRTIYDEYFIEMIFLDENGDVIESKKRNITHEEFHELIRHIETGEGVLFEGSV